MFKILQNTKRHTNLCIKTNWTNTQTLKKKNLKMDENCVFCNIITSRRCTVCNTYYCSIDCEHKNKEAHKIYCFPELHQRMKSILKLAHKIFPANRWTLSQAFVINGLELTAFGMYDSVTYCAICSNSAQNSYYNRRNFKNDEYQLCSNCNGKKLLCNISFMESEMCRSKQKSIGKT